MANRAFPVQWQDVFNLMLGIWFTVSPWILSYADQQVPAWNARVSGLSIAAASAAALIDYQIWQEWVNAIFAAWLIASPSLLGYSGLEAAFYNQIGVGVLAGVLAVWSAATTTG